MALGNFIDGQWRPATGDEFHSFSPATGQPVWTGCGSSTADVDQAFAAGRQAFTTWSGVSLADRIDVAQKFQALVREDAEAFATLISEEMGKPLWEARTEVAAVAGKVDLAIDALRSRRDTTRAEQEGLTAVTRYKPHGVLGVLGPYNLPAHLPNGHIVPALLAGNTVVFKPSELTPSIAEKMIGYWQQAELPAGVINLVQGGRDTGVAITQHPELDGLLFTGSSRAGIAINQALAAQPQKIVALEMGGNNPLIVHEVSDARAAAYQTVLSAYITSGQRCTCARRLILVDGPAAESLLDAVQSFLDDMRVGYFDDPEEPFIGPVVTAETGTRILAAQQKWLNLGGRPIRPLEYQRDNHALLSPGLIDVTGVDGIEDEEVFGPLLQVIRVDSFAAAIEEANRTRYGLAAGLLSDSPEHYETFIRRIRAGVVNWNRQTTGASGRLPFGGCGLSGNHRPSGFFAADYCSYPVASLEASQLILPDKLLPGMQ